MIARTFIVSTGRELSLFFVSSYGTAVISEIKRAFGATKANWKGLDGFKAYGWSSVLSYNLMRLARLDSS